MENRIVYNSFAYVIFQFLFHSMVALCILVELTRIWNNLFFIRVFKKLTKCIQKEYIVRHQEEWINIDYVSVYECLYKYSMQRMGKGY